MGAAQARALALVLQDFVLHAGRVALAGRAAQADGAPLVQRAAVVAQAQVRPCARLLAHPGAVGAGVGQDEAAVAVFDAQVLTQHQQTRLRDRKSVV